MSEKIQIQSGSIAKVVDLMNQLSEFSQPIKTVDDITERLNGKKHQILFAKKNELAIGFKLAYELDDRTLYSWLGGVLEPYRKNGVARKLAEYQENWARENGFSKIRFKTLNKHKAMLIFALKNGFEIKAVEIGETRDKIVLEKALN